MGRRTPGYFQTLLPGRGHVVDLHLQRIHLGSEVLCAELTLHKLLFSGLGSATGKDILSTHNPFYAPLLYLHTAKGTAQRAKGMFLLQQQAFTVGTLAYVHIFLG